MGRAIVRRPQVFLFDEPLSNLDAALRTQMRMEIKKLHQCMLAAASSMATRPPRNSAAKTAAVPKGTGALDKGLRLLGRISDAPTPLRFVDLLRDTGMPKATLHRLLGALSPTA
jgi:hypothetical protein